jgi:dihydroflavonol-4-reductase
VTVCITGATGFIGAHVAKLAGEWYGTPRVTYRDEARLPSVEVEPVRADVLDRGALRRAFRGCELVFHTAGLCASRPAERVWQINALAPRVVVEAAGAEEVRRVVLTSSVAAVGDDIYRSHGSVYADAKHEGEAEALAAGARLGVEIAVVNPSYALGAPVGPSRRDENSSRFVGDYLLGRLPAMVDGHVNVVDVRDVARGHLLAASEGRPGERYVLGGRNVTWTELLERVAALSGLHHPLVVVPGPPRPLAGHYSSRNARRELGYRPRSLDRTLRDLVAWYRSLIESGVLGGAPPTPLSLAATGIRLAERTGMLGGVRVAERYLGRRLVLRP